MAVMELLLRYRRDRRGIAAQAHRRRRRFQLRDFADAIGAVEHTHHCNTLSFERTPASDELLFREHFDRARRAIRACSRNESRVPRTAQERRRRTAPSR
jgi:hypothetical protein